MPIQQKNRLPNEEYLSEIRALVLARDEKALTQKVEAGECLFQGGHELLISLAEKGDIDSVNFLITKFQACRDYALMGFAKGNHIDYVNRLMLEGANPAFAVKGFAASGNFERVNSLISEMKELIYPAANVYAKAGYVEEAYELLARGANLNAILLSFAAGGHVSEVEKLIGEGSVCFAIFGYAFGGYVDEVNRLLEKYPDLINYAARAYAANGYVEQVNLLLEKGANKASVLLMYASSGYVEEVRRLIAEGVYCDPDSLRKQYAEGGYIKQAEEHATVSQLKVVLGGYAASGHIEHAKRLIKAGVDGTYYIVDGYASAGNVTEVNKLLEQDPNPYWIEAAVRAYAARGFVEEAAELYEKQSDEKVRENLMAVALTKYVGLQQLNGINHILARGENNMTAWLEILKVDEGLRNLVDNNQELKSQIVNAAQRNKSFNVSRSLTGLKNTMELHNFSVRQVFSVLSTNPEVKTWFLQGSEIVAKGFIKELYRTISCFLTHLSEQEVNQVFKFINNKIFNSVNKDHKDNPALFFQAKARYEKVEARREFIFEGKKRITN